MLIAPEDFNWSPTLEAPTAEGEFCVSSIWGSDFSLTIIGTPFLTTWYTVFHWGELTEGTEVGKGASVQFARALHA